MKKSIRKLICVILTLLTFIFTVTCSVNAAGVSEKTANVVSAVNTKAKVTLSSNVLSTGKPRIEWEPINGTQYYQVYRSESENGKYTKIGSPTKTGQTDTKAVTGKKYYYKVRAVCAGDIFGAFSAKIAIVCSPARPTVSASTVKSTGKPRIEWNPVSGAIYYQVYRSESENGKYTKIGSPTKTGQTDTKAVTGKKYYYKVRAVCAGDIFGAFSAKTTITCLPARPTVSSASVVKATGMPRLEWKAADGAVKYQVYRSLTPDGGFSRAVATSSLFYTDTDTNYGMTCYYKVRAVDEGGNYGAFSQIFPIKSMYNGDIVTPEI